jgi:hypothetical protein
LEWKKGRGKLGPLAPLIGTWRARADTPMGPVECTRTFTPVLGGKFVQLAARWAFAKGSYDELAIYGADAEGKLRFWSFTSDGKRSEGTLSEAADIHPQATCFEARMPAGIARMVYWPDPVEGFRWAVESKSKKGWNRFTEHHYTVATDG